ncbi:MAG: DUF1538 domain-containing protein [Bacilli bacterium]|jgi:hypothetical protein|nr:DUF1538 domain-containing protein [Bacilli bacterium]MCH4210154.1 DUF1538 domain-containing protein [Bacilli bacterium]MCH4228900.1 DUF1538 domain-containing protein [Bacilli bacterium]
MPSLHKRLIPPYLRKVFDSFLSVIPILVVVLVVYFVGIDPNFSYSHDISTYGWNSELWAFIFCAVMVALGLGLFSLGVDQSLSKIGNLIGSSLTKKQNVWLLIICTFLLGFLISVAEPDLWILGDQIGESYKWTIIITISIGVGFFLIVGTLRILFQLDLSLVFMAVYGLIFILANLASKELIPIAFDSGGVTTGPVTIPFIMAFGMGVASSRKGSHTGSDDFGLIAHATMGPILAIILLAIFTNTGSSLSYEVSTPYLAFSVSHYLASFGSSLLSVLFAVVPIGLFFLVYDLVVLHLSFKDVLKIYVGLLYCYLGLALFLSAVQNGFSPVAQSIGAALSSASKMPIAVLIGAIFGCFAVLAEPAVAVLVSQIQSASEGSIKKGGFMAVMALSIALAVALAIIRAYYGFSIMYYLVPGYILALGLTFVVPKIYSSIAFDAGTVASGPMAASFTMPFVIGFASAAYSSNGLSGQSFSNAVYENAFGVVAMVSMMPLIVVQLVGLYAGIKRKIVYRNARKRLVGADDLQIIHLPED